MRELSLIVAICLGLSACKTTGPVDNRFGHRWQWLGYLAGDDIREFCDLGSQDHLRLIYNANFNEETRTYDFVASPGGGADLTSQRWVGSSSILITGGNINSGIDAQTAVARIDATAMTELVGMLDRSDFYGPPLAGTTLRSDDFFWSGVACLDGEFHIQAYPRTKLSQVQFAGFLEAHDPLRVPLPPVVLKDLPALNALRQQGSFDNAEAPGALYYAAEVTEQGISGHWLN